MERYPICEVCGGEINPRKYDGCETYFVSQGQVLCRDCFIDEAQAFLTLDPEAFARAIGVQVVET